MGSTGSNMGFLGIYQTPFRSAVQKPWNDSISLQMPAMVSTGISKRRRISATHGRCPFLVGLAGNRWHWFRLVYMPHLPMPSILPKHLCLHTFIRSPVDP